MQGRYQGGGGEVEMQGRYQGGTAELGGDAAEMRAWQIESRSLDGEWVGVAQVQLAGGRGKPKVCGESARAAAEVQHSAPVGRRRQRADEGVGHHVELAAGE